MADDRQSMNLEGEPWPWEVRPLDVVPPAEVQLPWGRVRFSMADAMPCTGIVADKETAPPELLATRGDLASADALLAPVRRLALTKWLSRWDPYAIRADVLDLDIAMASREAGRSYDAFGLFDRRIPVLLDLLSWQADRVLPSTLVSELQKCSEAALAALGPAHSSYARLRAALDSLGAAREGVPDAAPSSLEEMDRLFGPSRDPALALGLTGLHAAAGGMLMAGHASAAVGAARHLIRRAELQRREQFESFDWWACHPRRSSTAGPDFSWTLRGRRVDVRLLSERVGSRPGPLVVRIADEVRGTILLESPIPPRQGSSTSFELPRNVSGIVVDMAELRHTEPVAVGPERRRREAQRLGIRALTLYREGVATLGFSSESAEELAERSAERARALLQTAPGELRQASLRLEGTLAQPLATPGSRDLRPTLGELLLAAETVGLAPP